MIQHLEPKVNGLVLDMDGVLWKEMEPIGNLPAIFDQIKRLGIKVVLATNNATRNVDHYIQKMKKFGVTLEPWQIATAAQATIRYLKQHFPNGGAIYVIGEEGLVEELTNAGYTIAEKDVIAVISSWDRKLTYDKLKLGNFLVRRGAAFLHTNPDPTFPTPEGLVPGAGAIMVAMEAATEQKAIVMGKPSAFLYEIASERMGTTLEDTLMVGDRLMTDIACGQNVGCRTALMLSGVTSLELAGTWQPQPTYIVKDLATLVGISA